MATFNRIGTVIFVVPEFLATVATLDKESIKYTAWTDSNKDTISIISDQISDFWAHPSHCSALLRISAIFGEKDSKFFPSSD